MTVSPLYLNGIYQVVTNPIQHLWDVVEQEIMDVQLSNLQELHDVVLSIWTKMSEAR